MREIIKEKTSIYAKDYNTPNMVSLEVLEFKNINGKWLLTGGYVEEE